MTPSMLAHPILALRDVTKTYGAGNGAVVALDRVTLTIQRGDYLGIMGPSGSGKTTLLNIMGGIDRPTTGEVSFDGERLDMLLEQKLLELRRNKIAYIFQEPRLMLSLSALENVMLPTVFGDRRARKDAKGRALELLEKVGLGKRGHHLVDELSGGEAQRVCIARALMVSPLLILADEPTGNLDHNTRLGIVELLERLNSESHTIIMVTHDPEIGGRARRQLVIADGRIVEDSGSPQMGRGRAEQLV